MSVENDAHFTVLQVTNKQTSKKDVNNASSCRLPVYALSLANCSRQFKSEELTINQRDQSTKWFLIA